MHAMVPSAARLAFGVTRPRPGLARPAPAGHRPSPPGAAEHPVPGVARGGPPACACCSGRAPFSPGATNATRTSWPSLESGPPPLPGREDLERRAIESIAWRPRTEWWRGLASLERGEMLRAQARDVLGPGGRGRNRRCRSPGWPKPCWRWPWARWHRPGRPPDGPGLGTAEGIAVVAMGRFGGAELAYAATSTSWSSSTTTRWPPRTPSPSPRRSSG